MDIQGFFIRQSGDIYDVDGAFKGTEQFHLTRQGIANNDFAHTHKFKGLLQANTILSVGDLVKVGTDNFLVMALRKIVFMNTNQANMWLCDSECSIYRLENVYSGNIKTGVQEIPIKENIPCLYKDTNGRIKIYDAGLLESTIKVVYLQALDVQLTDRLVLNGQNYQINSIDRTINNIMAIQLAEDKRDE